MYVIISNNYKTLYRGCYGFGNMGSGEKINENTLVYVASVTKAFTALSCAILVGQNKLSWDKPLINYVPGFETADTYITENATIVDLLSHRTGVAEFASLGYVDVSRADLLAELKRCVRLFPFRTTWLYNNSIYGIVGHIVEILSGLPWEAFVREWILNPLDMKSSDFSFVFDWPHNNRSKLYVKKEGEIERFVPPKSALEQFDTWGPAGSLNISACDMEKWLLFLLNRGAYRGKRIVSEENFDMLVKPFCIMDTAPEKGAEYFSTSCYALGWVSQSYKGRRVVWHNGSFGSFVSFMPDAQLGVAVVANMDSPLSRDLTYEIYDYLLGQNPV
jgi:CubicO group peptidase (beta-lactamase class C family)